MPKLSFVNSKQVNNVKWDNCVQATSKNGYELIQNLNATAQTWFGLVYENYEAIFPVFVRRKIGVEYCFQPLPLQRFSVCFCNKVDHSVVAEILNYIKAKFILVDICISLPEGYLLKEDFTEKDNFQLSLARPYNDICTGFSKKIVPLLKKAELQELVYDSCDLNVGYEYLLKELFHRVDSIDIKEYTHLRNYFEKSFGNQSLIVRAVKDLDGSLLAVGLFYKSTKAICYLKGVSNDAGRKASASHFLLAKIMEEYAEQDLLFDFAGSSIPSIAFFFKSFGAINEKYYRLYSHRIPKLVYLASKLQKRLFK